MNKEKIQARTLKGFNDVLPLQMAKKEKAINIIKNIYKSYGYLTIDTPALEYTEILLGKGSGETDKQLYRFEDNGGRDVALRFDLTIPFARYTAQHYNELIFPFKRYHIANVWRGENTQAGRYREFMQCDYDIIGTKSVMSDIETINIIYDTLKALGVNNFTIHINNRQIMNGLLNKLGLEEKQTDILRIIDKLGKIGKEKVSGLLVDEAGLTNEKVNEIIDFIELKGSNIDVIDELNNRYGDNDAVKEGIDRLETILNSLSELDINEEYISIDLSIARGLDYYTGIVFETFLNDLRSYGSICSGGRYDNLAGLYTKQILPGIGASIGLDRLLAALEELNVNTLRRDFIDVLILNFDEKLNPYYLKIAKELRDNGITTEIYPENKKISKQFSYADKKKFQLAIIVGENEKNEGVFNIRKIKTGERLDNLKISSLVKSVKLGLS